MQYNDYNISGFNYISLNDNDYLSKMSNSEKEELIIALKKIYLLYRKSIGLNDECSFGLEIEYNSFICNKSVQKEVLIFEDWSLEKEEYNLYEVITPVLYDDVKNWNKIKSMCSTIQDYGYISDTCAGHIHIGTQVLGSDIKSWLNFLKLWTIFEIVVFKFTAGEYYNTRVFVDMYADYCREVFIKTYDYAIKYMINDIYDLINNTDCLSKGSAINFFNVALLESFKKNNTIEFRCPNGTLNPIVWQNNVNLFTKMLMVCKNNLIDDDYINSLYLKYKDVKYTYFDYNQINLDLVFDFVDIIFDNNLDKVYFLRQYFKDSNTNNDVRRFKKAKKFTK